MQTITTKYSVWKWLTRVKPTRKKRFVYKKQMVKCHTWRHRFICLSLPLKNEENGWNQQVFRAPSVCGAGIDARNYLTVFEFKTKSHQKIEKRKIKYFLLYLASQKFGNNSFKDKTFRMFIPHVRAARVSSVSENSLVRKGVHIIRSGIVKVQWWCSLWSCCVM